MNIPDKAVLRKIKGRLLVEIGNEEYKDYPADTILELYEVQYIIPPTSIAPITTHIEYMHTTHNDLFWVPNEVEVLEDLGPYVKENKETE